MEIADLLEMAAHGPVGADKQEICRHRLGDGEKGLQCVRGVHSDNGHVYLDEFGNYDVDRAGMQQQ